MADKKNINRIDRDRESIMSRFGRDLPSFDPSKPLKDEETLADFYAQIRTMAEKGGQLYEGEINSKRRNYAEGIWDQFIVSRGKRLGIPEEQIAAIYEDYRKGVDTKKFPQAGPVTFLNRAQKVTLADFDGFDGRNPAEVGIYTPKSDLGGPMRAYGRSELPAMAPATLGLYSPEADRLEKRQILANELKRFAAGESEQTAESLKEQGKEVGVTPTQLSNLYKQYRKEIGSELMAGPPKPDGVGEPSVSSVKTPNLDRLAQMQNEPIGSRPMGSERRIITSPEGQMRLMARKAARAGIDVGQLVSANRGDVMAAFGELEAAGLGAKGIRTQEEVRSQPALQAQAREARASLLKEQAEAVRKAEAERIAKEEEEKRKAEEARIAKEEEEKRKEEERNASKIV